MARPFLRKMTDAFLLVNLLDRSVKISLFCLEKKSSFFARIYSSRFVERECEEEKELISQRVNLG